LKKILHYTFKVLKILIISLVAIYLIAYIYVVINKKKIIAQVTEQISKKINGNVKIGDADISFFRSFPRISVLVNDVSITDTMFAQHKHPFLAAKEVFVNLNILKLIQKESPLTGLRVKDGSIYLYTDTSGYTNTYMLKSKKDPEGGPKRTSGDVNLKSIQLDDFRITLDDKKKEKLHDFVVHDLYVKLDDDDKELLMTTDADILVNSLAFNLPRGTFLKDATFTGDFKMKYGKESQVLSFDSIDIKLSGQKFNMSGSFDLGDKNPAFALRIHVRNLIYNDIKKLLPKRIDSSLSIVSLDKPLDADAQLNGPLHGGEPYIYANWNVKKTHLATPFLDFDDASFTGFYMNEMVKGLPRKDPNSMLSISNFTATWHSLPVTSQKIEILNLAVPELTADLHSTFPLKSLNEVVQTNSLQFTAGDASVVLAYIGPMQYNTNTNSFLNGNIAFENGIINYTPKGVQMKDVYGLLVFNNSNVTVQNLKATVLGNKVVMNGSAKNLLTLVNTAPNQVVIDWNVFSPSLNLAAFTSLLGERTKVSGNSGSSKSTISKMSAKIDDVLEKSVVDLKMQAGSIVYKKLTAQNFDADITIRQDQYTLNNISMNTAGGKLVMNGQLITQSGNSHQATLNTTMTNVDVKKIFYAFDNFGQDGITSESLGGQLTAKVNATLSLDKSGGVIPSSAKGIVDFSLKNGELNNYEPIKKIQSFIFKKRDFDNIRFAELKDRFEINGGEIKMNRMEIQSSVISLFVEGIYKRGSGSDISIQVPLSNLKKRSEDYNPVNIGTDKKGGRSIFLRGQTGSDGNVNFKLDLFNKFKKEKNAKDPES
jgi:hypothetical protein